jgi:hypothetical protein
MRRVMAISGACFEWSMGLGAANDYFSVKYSIFYEFMEKVLQWLINA